mmetsp:Transcript_66295/g.158601  ORF Transcript_66295/g.158601 Transcript_66295/m.158601 type:complete len:276 (+) Transcript_66295:77-904(+)|eukprot:CAMPEP_0178444250 /NCGR_PEP_ID=MMETSP0689_2-20121128/39382_1 /TAXON_ID=160604 /ORGANISM="Amphidinium massartii, Strain CS-259" /LENGTH=275 /DNA_ID=CAMNT_0020068419 /DNA_START=77 /DNA_END=904 /DNA_ORIENTATION=+
MPKSQVQGINDITRRLRIIADQCCDKQKEEEAKDEFSRIKVRMYELLEEVRENIRHRQALLKSRGHCMESIQKGHAVRQSLQELKESLTKLQALLRKQSNKRGARKKAEETEAKYLEIRQLKKQVNEAQALFDGQIAELVDFPELSDSLKPTLFGNSLRMAAQGDTDRAMTDEEKALKNEIRGRDEDLDKDIEQIGVVAGRLGMLAAEMGTTAQRQKGQVEGINADAEKANQELEAMNKKIAEVIRYERNTTCCCQIFLGLALLCVVGFIFQILM